MKSGRLDIRGLRGRQGGDADADLAVHLGKHVHRRPARNVFVGKLHDGEFVTAEAKRHIHLIADRRAHGMGHLVKVGIAELMAEFIVDLFEKIEIEQQQRQRLGFLAPRTIEGLGQFCIVGAPIEQAR